MAWPKLTLGIEEEYQIIDPKTRQLAPFSGELIVGGQEILDQQIRSELMQSRVEAGSNNADRQLRTFRETGSLKAVTDRLVEQTREGCA